MVILEVSPSPFHMKSQGFVVSNYSDIVREIGELIMKLKSINLNLEVGQEILVGEKNQKAEITKIEFHEKSGEIVINTTKGPRKALTFRLCETV